MLNMLGNGLCQLKESHHKILFNTGHWMENISVSSRMLRCDLVDE